jgi:uncharacterized membrane protein YcaP (DUF421 family)
MWQLSAPWWEFLLRALVVYVFLLILLRLTGKRQVGQLAPFDLVLLLVLSNAVQNSMNGGDNSITAGIILASTLVLLNYSVGWMTHRSKRLEGIVEGHPLVLIHNGHVYRDVMEQEKVTQHELDAALREAGCSSISEVHFAVMETNGKITVQPRNNKGHNH